LLVSLSLTRVNAQAILNNSFETWYTDTAFFDGFSGFFPSEEFMYTDPEDWTTTNALTGADTLGHFFFVTESANAHTGSKAIQLTTGVLDTVGTPLGPRQLTIPGLALNGKFPLELEQSLLTGGTISPAAIPGAGQPFTQRLGAIKGFYNYTPVFNTPLNRIDSCTVWAILRKGTKVVASAQFTSGVNTAGQYVAFSAPFTYVACDDPDTLVVLLAASVPSFGSILSGQTDLVPGSVLLVDDLDYDLLAPNFNYPPIAINDADTTTKNVAVNVLVKTNDDDCNDGTAGLTLAVTTPPLHGTATAVGTTHITYTPATDFVGIDSFFYTISDGTGTSSPARVRMLTLNGTGISDVAQVPVTVYPVPASTQLNIQFENNGKSTLRVFNMLGSLVLSSNLNKNINSINIETLSNGVYNIQIADENNAVIARSKFTVSK
ncbi:MAG TPA: T9SS type A sorting domain-containing protein, partial [Chitinophagales bacterium]|nr:T9SS type A sorting domain-containing protein [Chitinophagales bacterium]